MGCGHSQVGIAPKAEDNNNRPTDKPESTPGSTPGTSAKVKVERPRSKTIEVKENNSPANSPVLLKVSNKYFLLCYFI